MGFETSEIAFSALSDAQRKAAISERAQKTRRAPHFKAEFFDKQKKDCLSKADKSSIGNIDKDIRPLIDLLNSKKDYYTTSSCSGRILLIDIKSDKKTDARFVFAEHKKASFKSIKNTLKKLPKSDIWLRQESIIIHVCCRNQEAALRLLKAVRDLGIKRAGIISVSKRVMLEIIGTESMEAIIARHGKVLVEDTYLKILLEEANKKLERNKKKIKELCSIISSLS